MVIGNWHYHWERLTTQQTNLCFIALYTTLMGWTINYGYLWHGFFSKFTVELDNSCLMEWSFTCKFMAFKNSPGFLAVRSLLCWWMATIKRICQRCQVTTNDFGWAQAKVHLHFIKFSSIAVEFWLSNFIVPNWQS